MQFVRRQSDAIRRIQVLCWHADNAVGVEEWKRVRRRQDDGLSPLQAMVEDRLKELGLGRSDLARRMGYSNIGKGCRRVDELLGDDLFLAVRLRKMLARGLALEVEGRRQRNRSHRREGASVGVAAVLRELRSACSHPV